MTVSSPCIRRHRGPGIHRLGLLFAALWVGVGGIAHPALEAAPGDREFRVQGYGIFGNRSLARIVDILSTGEEPDDHFSPAFLENVLLLLHAQVERNGYFRPHYSLSLVSTEGETLDREWDGRAWLDLPPDFLTRSARVRVDRGTRFYFEQIEFSGLEAISPRQAERYFISGGYLIDLKRYRVFSPAVLRSGQNNLREELRLKGYRDAEVVLQDREIDEETGEVAVVIGVDEGPRYQVVDWQERWIRPDLEVEGVTLESRSVVREPWSQLWQRQQLRETLNRFYRAGYPDAEAQVSLEMEEIEERDTVAVTVRVTVDPGPRVRVAGVEFVAQGKTLDSVLHRRIHLEAGDWLDVLEVEEARYRIARLGVYRSIETDVTDSADEEGGEEPPARTLRFEFEEDQRLIASLLLGYGSYEKLRGGPEIERRNLWGRAHRDRLRAIQSFKSSSIDYRYYMPEIFAEDIDVYGEANGLRRRELSFDRVEWGGEVRFLKEFSPRTRASIAYRAEQLRIIGLEQDPEDFIGRRATRVGALQFSYNRDTRDNPLHPARGGQLRGELELGSPFLGAAVTYQRLTLLGSRHWEWREGLIFHSRLSHGIVTTYGDTAENLPINKRFFPGGAHSIRGFRQGGASPRDSEGRFIGAEASSLLQLELEQALSPSLSAVIFADNLYYARDYTNYPGDTHLATVGLGVRYRTVVGPLRIELGYNLNPREADPEYRLQLSLGYPF